MRITKENQTEVFWVRITLFVLLLICVFGIASLSYCNDGLIEENQRLTQKLKQYES